MNAPRKWNPRYVAYAKVNGHTPESMLEHDRQVWLGGIMCGFILWINQKLRDYYELKGADAFLSRYVLTDQNGFTAYLEALPFGSSLPVFIGMDFSSDFLQEAAANKKAVEELTTGMALDCHCANCVRIRAVLKNLAQSKAGSPAEPTIGKESHD